jgi:hypothetical protein
VKWGCLVPLRNGVYHFLLLYVGSGYNDFGECPGASFIFRRSRYRRFSENSIEPPPVTPIAVNQCDLLFNFCQGFIRHITSPHRIYTASYFQWRGTIAGTMEARQGRRMFQAIDVSVADEPPTCVYEDAKRLQPLLKVLSSRTYPIVNVHGRERS